MALCDKSEDHPCWGQGKNGKESSSVTQTAGGLILGQNIRSKQQPNYRPASTMQNSTLPEKCMYTHWGPTMKRLPKNKIDLTSIEVFFIYCQL